MRTALYSILLFTVMLALINPAAAGEAKGTAKIDDAVEVLEQLVSIPEKTIPPALLGNAGGIAIIPNVIKAGFIIGGRYGNGVLMTRKKDGQWSDPVFITLAGGSIGWQAGVESVDIILVFKNARSVEGIIRGKFTLGADASIAAGPVGRQASAATDIQLKSEIYSYSRTRGLFAGLSLEGASMQINYDANEAFYGKPGIAAGEILVLNCIN
ncbi:MAG: lipid-binding SYLF domain-containing protein [Deltaproteobacteria bacterium]|nr:lipid-binding SYLF domain-containing protein [Deltaproteobacteria bacterium]